MKLHGTQADNSVVMIGNGYRYGIKMFMLLIEHLTPVMIIGCLREFFADGCRLPVIHIAKVRYDNIFPGCFHKSMNIRRSFSPTANSGNIKLVTRSNMTQPADSITRHNRESSDTGSRQPHKFPPG